MAPSKDNDEEDEYGDEGEGVRFMSDRWINSLKNDYYAVKAASGGRFKLQTFDRR